MYIFLRILFGLSIAAPSFIWILTDKDWSLQFPVFVAIVIQTIVGLSVFIFTGGETKKSTVNVFGMSLIFFSQTGAIFAGKTLWLPIFWELSTLGTFLTYLDGNFGKSNIRSAIALLGASGMSAVFLAAWVFLPYGTLIGQTFFLVGLLIKSAYSSSHIWYPEFHSGVKPEISALYSGVVSTLPPLLFLQYFVPNVGIETYSKILVPVAGLGVFLGGVSAFYSKEIRKILAYSSIETLNFLWLCLFLYIYWQNSPDEVLQGMAFLFLVLFYLSLLQHSFSKTFQIISFGYLSESCGSSHIDFSKGMGRISGLSPMVLGFGTFSYLLVPGSLGFLSESTYLFIASQIVDLPAGSVFIITPVLIVIVMGLVLGSAAHLRLYLTAVLSMPFNKIQLQWKEVKSKQNFAYSLIFLGIIIFVLPTVLLIFFVYGNVLPQTVNILLHTWFEKLLYVSGLSILAYSVFLMFLKPHRIQKRSTWDCGSNYSGDELSVSGSTFSDPVHYSVGVLSDKETGVSVVDTWIQSQLVRILDIGRLWIKDAEMGSLSNYIAFSAFGLLISIVLIVIIRFNQGFYASF